MSEDHDAIAGQLHDLQTSVRDLRIEVYALTIALMSGLVEDDLDNRQALLNESRALARERMKFIAPSP